MGRLHRAGRRGRTAARIEYSVSLASGGHVVGNYVSADGPAAFIRCEEKILGFVLVIQAWNPKGPAQHIPKIIEPQFTSWRAGRIQEKVVCVQFVIAEELIDTAVEILSARFGDHINYTSRHLAEFGAEVVSQHLEFFQRIERRRHYVTGIGADVHVVLAIDEPQVRVALAPVAAHIVIAPQARLTAYAPIP